MFGETREETTRRPSGVGGVFFFFFSPPFEAVFTDPQLPHLEGGSPRWKAKLEKYRSSHLSGWIRGRLRRCQERLRRLAARRHKGSACTCVRAHARSRETRGKVAANFSILPVCGEFAACARFCLDKPRGIRLASLLTYATLFFGVFFLFLSHNHTLTAHSLDSAEAI